MRSKSGFTWAVVLAMGLTLCHGSETPACAKSIKIKAKDVSQNLDVIYKHLSKPLTFAESQKKNIALRVKELNCLDRLCSEAIDRNPKDSKAYFYRSYATHMTSSLRECLFDLNKAIELNPGYLEALVWRATVKKLNDDKTGALADLEAVSKLDPVAGAVEKSRLLFYKKDSHASKVIDEGLRLAPKNTDLRILKARLSIRSGKYLEAKRELDVVLRLDSEIAEAYSLRANCECHLNNMGAALKDCNRALDIDELYPDALHTRAAIKEKAGDMTGALCDSRDGLVCYAGIYDRLKYAELCCKMGEISQCKMTLRSIFTAGDKPPPSAYFLMAQILTRDKEYLGAASMFAQGCWNNMFEKPDIPSVEYYRA